MTRPLHTIIDPTEGRMGRAKPCKSSVRHFVFFSHRSKRHCPQGQPNKNWTVISCIDRLDFISSLPPENHVTLLLSHQQAVGRAWGRSCFYETWLRHTVILFAFFCPRILKRVHSGGYRRKGSIETVSACYYECNCSFDQPCLV